MSDCKACAPVGDVTSDTVKVNTTLLAPADAKLPSAAQQTGADGEHDAARESERERELEQEERRRKEAEGRRLEEELRLAAEAEAEAEAQRQREREEAKRVEREAREREERERQEAREREEREREEREAAEAAARAAEQAERDAEERRKKEKTDAEQKVAKFLKESKFNSVSQPRTSCMTATYPLHVAVEKNNSVLVRALLLCGADASCKNSSGKTPCEVAKKLNKNGSHAAVVRLLEH